MLVHNVARKFGAAVEVVSENYGASELAQRFGIKRYPAVFINDVLIAKPKDFGYFGETGSQGAGRYTPWLDTSKHGLFRDDLVRSIQQALAGTLEATEHTEEAQLTALPEFAVADLQGRSLGHESCSGKVVVVEFWATWCPPCRQSLSWLAALQRRHANELQIIAIAVESKEGAVRRFAEQGALPFPVVLGTPELAQAFGDVIAVPTLLIFDATGALVNTELGAPPGQKEKLTALLEALLKG